MIQTTIRRFGIILSFAFFAFVLTSATMNKAVARKHRIGRYRRVHARIYRGHGKIRHIAFRTRVLRHKHYARFSRRHVALRRQLTAREKTAIVQKIRALARRSSGVDDHKARNSLAQNSSGITHPAKPRDANLGGASEDDSVVAAEAESPDVQSQIAEAAKEERAEDGIDASIDKYFKARPDATGAASTNAAANGASAANMDATAIDQSPEMASALDPALDAERQPDITLFDETDPSHAAQRSDVMDNIIDWIGTRYRFGGESRSGIDCSAFTQKIFSKSFGLDLPRTAYDQSQLGVPVSEDHLQFGDLVFFRTARYAPVTHVGIYIGEGRFASAACSRGVAVASLGSAYWSKHYVGARRLFSNSGMASANASPAASALADGNN